MPNNTIASFVSVLINGQNLTSHYYNLRLPGGPFQKRERRINRNETVAENARYLVWNVSK
jgi:hypothetical protein